MDAWIQDLVRSCPQCIRRKPCPSSAPLVSITSSAPMVILCIEYLQLERSRGGVGGENVLVVTDHFTRCTQAYPSKNQTARTKARVLFDQFISHYGS